MKTVKELLEGVKNKFSKMMENLEKEFKADTTDLKQQDGEDMQEWAGRMEVAKQIALLERENLTNNMSTTAMSKAISGAEFDNLEYQLAEAKINERIATIEKLLKEIEKTSGAKSHAEPEEPSK